MVAERDWLDREVWVANEIDLMDAGCIDTPRPNPLISGVSNPVECWEAFLCLG